MAAFDARQRRAVAAPPSPSYVEATSSAIADEPTHSLAPLPLLTSRWRRVRDNAHLAQRAAMRFLEASALAFAMFIVPASIQHLVRGIDTLYEVAGRRSRTSFDEVDWWRVGVGGGVLTAWHVVLIALSFRALADPGQGSKRGDIWGRILGRVLVPVYLFVALVTFFYTLATRLTAPRAVRTAHAFSESSVPHR